MELMDLRCFVELAQRRHFGNAAKQLHISQPQLSQRMQRLERELRTALLARTTRSVSLTPEGETFLADATDILARTDAAVRHMHQLADGEQGTLRLGVIGSAAYAQLPRIAHVVERDLPGVRLAIHAEMLTPAQEAALLDRTIDAGVLRLPVRSPGLAHRVLDREALTLALPAEHRLARRTDLAMADLAEEPFVTYKGHSGSVVREAVVRSCETAGFLPHIAIEASETSTVVALVTAGFGVALVPESARALTVAGIGYHAVPGTASVDVALAWRRDNTSGLLRRFWDVLEAAGLFDDARGGPDDSPGVKDPVREPEQ
jgi:DNA-binding transcriptional LysR family regulator